MCLFQSKKLKAANNEIKLLKVELAEAEKKVAEAEKKAATAEKNEAAMKKQYESAVTIISKYSREKEERALEEMLAKRENR